MTTDLKKEFRVLGLEQWIKFAAKHGCREIRSSVRDNWKIRVFKQSKTKSFFLIKGGTINVINY